MRVVELDRVFKHGFGLLKCNFKCRTIIPNVLEFCSCWQFVSRHRIKWLKDCGGTLFCSILEGHSFEASPEVIECPTEVQNVLLGLRGLEGVQSIKFSL